MRLIIPMAGEGKRLRPHTFTTPKPLFPLLGKPVVEWLVEEVGRALAQPIEAMVFIVRELSADHRAFLERLAQRWGSQAIFCTQSVPLGTAHALYQARDYLQGPCVILFADTIFTSSATIRPEADGALWVKEVSDPRSYGVVELSPDGYIRRLVEKPPDPPSNLAIIGVYFLRQAEWLLPAIEYLFERDIRVRGEYQLTDALQWLCETGRRLQALPVEEWLDCGSRLLILQAQARLLERGAASLPSPPPSAHILPPVWIAPNAEVEASVIGPYVAIEAGARVYRSILSHTLCRTGAVVEASVLHNSLIGAHAYCRQAVGEIDLGDYSRYGVESA
ncbi:MAG: sugar phosphate nucleotidyltransferase [Bacteroidia bacterium]